MITPDSDILAEDFINESEKDATPANDEGRVPKLEDDAQLSVAFIRKHLKFGGTGADGALAISSGTTTIDLAGAQVVVKNYTSISITGTGKLAFSNPHNNGTIIILKSQGNVTLTSSQAPMIDASGMGGDIATAGTSFIGSMGTPGGGSTQGNGFAGGVKATALTPTFYNTGYSKFHTLFAGGGGNTGATATGGTANPGIGGRGGGGLYIECGGAWNFTTSSGISVAGKNGTNAQGDTQNASGGGGGGGGGMFLALYNSLTANTGSVVITGGNGGNGGTGGGTSGNGAGGAGGGAGFYDSGAGGSGGSSGGPVGGTGGAGGTTGAGSGGGSTGGAFGGGGGGGGSAGISLIALNTEFT